VAYLEVKRDVSRMSLVQSLKCIYYLTIKNNKNLKGFIIDELLCGSVNYYL